MRSYRVAVSVPPGMNHLPLSLTPTEMRKLRPAETPRRMTVLFLRGYVQILPLDIALALREQYPALHVVDAAGRTLDRPDDLDGLSWSELTGLAGEYGIDTAGMSPLELRFQIRDHRNELQRSAVALS